MDNRKIVIVAVVIVLVAAGAAWALGMFGGNAEFAELDQLREQMFASRDLPDAERQQLRDQFPTACGKPLRIKAPRVLREQPGTMDASGSRTDGRVLCTGRSRSGRPGWIR